MERVDTAVPMAGTEADCSVEGRGRWDGMGCAGPRWACRLWLAPLRYAFPHSKGWLPHTGDLGQKRPSASSGKISCGATSAQFPSVDEPGVQ